VTVATVAMVPMVPMVQMVLVVPMVTMVPMGPMGLVGMAKGSDEVVVSLTSRFLCRFLLRCPCTWCCSRSGCCSTHTSDLALSGLQTK
jgi:hypothetical protein